MRSILDIAQALPGVTSGGRLLARFGQGRHRGSCRNLARGARDRAQFAQSGAEGRLYRNVATARPPQHRRDTASPAKAVPAFHVHGNLAGCAHQDLVQPP